MPLKQDFANKLSPLQADINRLQNQVTGLEQILENVEARLHVRIAQKAREANDAMLRQRAAICARMPRVQSSASVDLTPPPGGKTLDECYAELKKMAPKAFAVWRKLIDVNAHTYDGLPTHSCSVAGHEMAASFGRFLMPYLTGTVLDIGCGPQAVPLYLGDHPPELIAGIDPLPPDETHPFAFSQCVCEFLPWKDETFDLVVVATSLDHVLLVDRSLREMCRVLAPGGRLAIWISFIAGAERYDPYRSKVQPIDEHHLFHFDRPWFEEMMDEEFVCTETVSFIEATGSCFYAFEKRPV